MKQIKLIFAILIAISFASCEPETPASKKEIIEFTVRYSEVSYNYAIINVKHNGPEDLTWYGFVTEDVTGKNYNLYTQKRKELLQAGKIEGLKKETDRNILLEGLKENTKYKYVVFGIQANGDVYSNTSIGSIEFETSLNAYQLQETSDWTISYLGRNDDQTKDIIEVKANKGGRFAWQYVSKESIESFNKEYPGGYELWEDDIYMATLDGVEMFALQEIATIQYYIYNGHKLTDLTYVYEADKPFEIDRLASGDYYFIAYGFQGDGNHTRTYSVQEIHIEEEQATDAYNKWLGNYSFSGTVEVAQADGEVVPETRTYNLLIEKYDNNFMYRIHGWECGEDVKYDWEEDITQIDKEKGQFLAFPAYFEKGKLVIKEQPMTYISFDGSMALKLGMYGYAFNEQYGEFLPVLFDGKTMAIADPIADGQTSTVLIGQDGKYDYTDENGAAKVLEWTYSKMGYIAYDDASGSGAWQAINPAMNFPITITRTDRESASGGNIQTGSSSAVSGLSLFNSKKITTDFLKKDFKPAEKINPAIFKTVQ